MSPKDRENVDQALRDLELCLEGASKVATYLIKGRDQGGYHIPCLIDHAVAIEQAHVHVTELMAKLGVAPGAGPDRSLLH